MKNCKYCGTPLNDNEAFCRNCGQPADGPQMNQANSNPGQPGGYGMPIPQQGFQNQYGRPNGGGAPSAKGFFSIAGNNWYDWFKMICLVFAGLEALDLLSYALSGWSADSLNFLFIMTNIICYFLNLICEALIVGGYYLYARENKVGTYLIGGGIICHALSSVVSGMVYRGFLSGVGSFLSAISSNWLPIIIVVMVMMHYVEKKKPAAR